MACHKLFITLSVACWCERLCIYSSGLVSDFELPNPGTARVVSSGFLLQFSRSHSISMSFSLQTSFMMVLGFETYKIAIRRSLRYQDKLQARLGLMANWRVWCPPPLWGWMQMWRRKLRLKMRICWSLLCALREIRAWWWWNDLKSQNCRRDKWTIKPEAEIEIDISGSLFTTLDFN